VHIPSFSGFLNFCYYFSSDLGFSCTCKKKKRKEEKGLEVLLYAPWVLGLHPFALIIMKLLIKKKKCNVTQTVDLLIGF
jgi:hypothetical protein